MIEINGKKYKVVENLGYKHEIGYVKIVSTSEGERAAVRLGSEWTWQTNLMNYLNYNNGVTK